MGVGFLSIQSLCLLMGTFSPFTFNVIIDRYVLIAILLIVFGLFLLLLVFLSSFSLFPCDLMTIVSAMFEFLSLLRVCTY